MNLIRSLAIACLFAQTVRINASPEGRQLVNGDGSGPKTPGAPKKYIRNDHSHKPIREHDGRAREPNDDAWLDLLTDLPIQQFLKDIDLPDTICSFCEMRKGPSEGKATGKEGSSEEGSSEEVGSERVSSERVSSERVSNDEATAADVVAKTPLDASRVRRMVTGIVKLLLPKNTKAQVKNIQKIISEKHKGTDAREKESSESRDDTPLRLAPEDSLAASPDSDEREETNVPEAVIDQLIQMFYDSDTSDLGSGEFHVGLDGVLNSALAEGAAAGPVKSDAPAESELIEMVKDKKSRNKGHMKQHKKKRAKKGSFLEMEDEKEEEEETEVDAENGNGNEKGTDVDVDVDTDTEDDTENDTEDDTENDTEDDTEDDADDDTDGAVSDLDGIIRADTIDINEEKAREDKELSDFPIEEDQIENEDEGTDEVSIKNRKIIKNAKKIYNINLFNCEYINNWNFTKEYIEEQGSLVQLSGYVFQNLLNSDAMPTANVTDWKLLGACDYDSYVCGALKYVNTIYHKGSRVLYNNRIYESLNDTYESPDHDAESWIDQTTECF